MLLIQRNLIVIFGHETIIHTDALELIQLWGKN